MEAHQLHVLRIEALRLPITVERATSDLHDGINAYAWLEVGNGHNTTIGAIYRCVPQDSDCEFSQDSDTSQ